MGSLQSDIGELAHHLKQERLFLQAEKHQIQQLNDKVCGEQYSTTMHFLHWQKYTKSLQSN